ncbi:hypothetical protein C4571_00610 [Candidatus Parcubacteria bacterium]|nr:MAG: hypothetical protein C4571_00610 [Candidatus Parcubacteria bacterium]
MKLLHGITAPAGEGTVLEVHLDLERTTPVFDSWLGSVGFEGDPFTIFYPAWCTRHMTGRMRTRKEDLAIILPEVNALIANAMKEAKSHGIDLYSEVELVRDIKRFSPPESRHSDAVLDSLCFSSTGRFGTAKADVHVEFPSGEVSPEVREYLTGKKFYWVATPPSAHFPAEEIATLQTSTYKAAEEVYRLLSAKPLRGCTAIHLEQKLSMAATRAGLPMPETIEVTGW